MRVALDLTEKQLELVGGVSALSIFCELTLLRVLCNQPLRFEKASSLHLKSTSKARSSCMFDDLLNFQMDHLPRTESPYPRLGPKRRTRSLAAATRNILLVTIGFALTLLIPGVKMGIMAVMLLAGPIHYLWRRHRQQ